MRKGKTREENTKGKRSERENLADTHLELSESSSLASLMLLFSSSLIVVVSKIRPSQQQKTIPTENPRGKKVAENSILVNLKLSPKEAKNSDSESIFQQRHNHALLEVSAPCFRERDSFVFSRLACSIFKLSPKAEQALFFCHLGPTFL